MLTALESQIMRPKSNKHTTSLLVILLEALAHRHPVRRQHSVPNLLHRVGRPAVPCATPAGQPTTGPVTHTAPIQHTAA